MILLLFFTLLLGFFLFRQYRGSGKLPPGPLAFPIIGNIPQLAYYIWRKEGIVPAFDFFRKKYGNIFTLWVGPFPHVSICDFDTNQEVFVKNGNRYKNRLLPSIFDHLSEGHGLVFANGEIWAEMRRFTLLTLRNMGVGRDVMEERIMEELDVRCEGLKLQEIDGTAIVSTSEFFDVVVGSIINSILVGKRFDEHNIHEFKSIQQLVHDSGEAFTPFELMSPVWLLKYCFPSRYRLLMDSMLAVNKYVAREANQRFEDLKNGTYELDRDNPNDFVDTFLAKMDKNEGNPAYSMKSLEFVLADLWSAGQDTTSTTLTSGFNQLVNNPDVIRKVREELLKITDNGSRTLSLKDRTITPYLNATLAEIQRCASIGNVSLWKTSEGQKTVNGYELGDGVILTSQIGALHVNEDIFEDPEKFYPERFIENEELLHQLIPFGLGKRSCIGENLARSELYLIFGNLLLRYDIKPHGNLPETKDQMPYTSLKQPDRSGRIEFRKL